MYLKVHLYLFTSSRSTDMGSETEQCFAAPKKSLNEFLK